MCILLHNYEYGNIYFIMCTHVTCDFMMCLGCYGDVLRVKILYNKKDSALIQFAESFQAQTGW